MIKIGDRVRAEGKTRYRGVIQGTVTWASDDGRIIRVQDDFHAASDALRSNFYADPSDYTITKL